MPDDRHVERPDHDSRLNKWLLLLFIGRSGLRIEAKVAQRD